MVQAVLSTGRNVLRSVMDREPRPTATIPDWTSSLMPNGSSTRMSASSLSAVPVASMVTASGATSTTLARNSCTVSRTCERVSRSAFTLTRSSSRCTDAVGSSSTIFRTLTSLLSCFVTCSSGRSSTSTTIVMRLTVGCSVGPTASDEMLNPRRLNRLATRARTPGLSSTRTERVCRVRAMSDHPVAVPVGPRVAGREDLVVARAGRHHRPHHRVLADDEVDDAGRVLDRHGLLDRRVDVALAVAPQPDAAHRISELHEVGDALRLQVGVGVAALVEQRLPLANHAEVAVVDDRDLDGDPLDGAGDQLLVGHLEAAVTVDRPDGGLGPADLRAHGCGHGVAHGAEPPGVEPGVGVLVGDELAGPHLV